MGMKSKIGLCIATVGLVAITWKELRKPEPQVSPRVADAPSPAASDREPADGRNVSATSSAGTTDPSASERQHVEPPGPADALEDLDHPLVGEVLKQFWGARWDEVRPKYEERIPLTERIPRLPAWTEVEPQVCERMKMDAAQVAGVERRYLPPNPVTPAYLRQEHGFDEATWTDADAQRLEVDLQDVRFEGAQALSAYREVVDGALRARCLARRYDHMPVANIENPSTPPRAIYASAFAISGWVISVGLGSEEVPQLEEVKANLEALKQKSAATIARFLAGRK
jgi:hypothetical protein